MDLSATIKGKWVVSKEYEPPYGHAEQTSLKVFLKKMTIDIDSAIRELRAEGIQVEKTTDSLEKIAEANETTPLHLYMLVKKFEKKSDGDIAYTPESVEEQFAGTGIGRKTLSQIIEDAGIERGIAAGRLRENDISVRDDETLKAAADRNGVKPIDILTAILVEDYRIEKGGGEGH